MAVVALALVVVVFVVSLIIVFLVEFGALLID